MNSYLFTSAKQAWLVFFFLLVASSGLSLLFPIPDIAGLLYLLPIDFSCITEDFTFIDTAFYPPLTLSVMIGYGFFMMKWSSYVIRSNEPTFNTQKHSLFTLAAVFLGGLFGGVFIKYIASIVMVMVTVTMVSAIITTIMYAKKKPTGLFFLIPAPLFGGVMMYCFMIKQFAYDAPLATITALPWMIALVTLVLTIVTIPSFVRVSFWIFSDLIRYKKPFKKILSQ